MNDRKEIDKLSEIEDNEQLEQDCSNTKNIAMQYIKRDAIKHLEELRVEFIKTNNIHREEQVTVNRVFKFLKERA